MFRTLPKSDQNLHGIGDLFVVNPAKGTSAVFYLSNTNGSLAGQQTPVPAIPTNQIFKGATNFDYDADVDWAFLDKQTGKVQLWFTEGLNVQLKASLTKHALPPGYDVMATGDINRNGNSDLVLLNKATGQSAFWLLKGAFWKVKSGGLDLRCQLPMDAAPSPRQPHPSRTPGCPQLPVSRRRRSRTTLPAC